MTEALKRFICKNNFVPGDGLVQYQNGRGVPIGSQDPYYYSPGNIETLTDK